MVVKVEILGNVVEAERLRGFALSQLRVLLDTMKFQGLKQYTRVVRFCDGSYVRAFSSFGIDTVTVFVPPVSVPEREIVEVVEAVYITVEPCEVGFEVPAPTIEAVCEGAWVEKGTKSSAGAPGTVYCSPKDEDYTEVITIVGTQKWMINFRYCTDRDGASWAYPAGAPVDPPCGGPNDCWQITCTNGDCFPRVNSYWYYEWECT